MKMNTSVATQDAKARRDMYRFLSSVYLLPPSKDFLLYIVSKETIDELSVLFGGNAVEVLREFAATVDIDKDLLSIKQEYLDLFAVPTGRYVAPFEDVYRGKMGKDQQARGPLLGEYAIAVKKIYRSSGAKMERTCKELPTHIGVELSFMCFLCEMEVEVIANQEGETFYDQAKREVTDIIRYRKIEIKFLQEHLNEWFPQLSKSIQINSRSQLYCGLTIIIEKFLSQDTAFLLAIANSEICKPEMKTP
ncbi:anaerobic dehydrogenase [Candidatus Scalindua japonica]|uniref:Anaerobic dehydrogenase n=1 Tax=Candidatus Scalindua japonica TaxID=1284222 RepID=A0A286TWW1_9BACT|nr:molecular chaperone TorD family protein [Candidatus Scalindua japonica]GAX60331.1 anaerobic dehydrogenase [Candidatus Scalindua japonica]